MKKVLHYLKPYWWMLLLALATTSVTVWASLHLPTMMANIVNDGIIKTNQDYIISEGLRMLGVTAIGAIATVITGFLASRIANGYSRDLRNATFSKIESFSQAEINQFSNASLITRSTNDVQQMQMVTLMVIRIAFQAPIMAVGAIVSAINTAPSMAWIMAAGVVALLVLVSVIFGLVVPKFGLAQKLIDRLNLVTRENLTGLRVIRAFNNERIEEKKFTRANREITNLNLWINRVISIMQPGMMLIINFTLLAVVWFGAHFISTGNLEIGNMMAFMQYAMQVITSFLMLVMIAVFVPRAQVSGKRIGEILNTKNSIKEPEHPEQLADDNRATVEFRDVTFSYPGAESPVLNDLNFVAEPGKTTAFIGSTGSGKSTLINLVPRFYDVSSGQVLINGVDVRKLSHDELVKLIGYVPQKGILFSGTVESNIKYGAPKLDEKEVQRAADIAQADFIKDLDKGMKSRIAQGGANVSGGQKQRLAIARAIAKNSPILIFDDSFSALDYKTDAALRKALEPITSDKTVMIVAQRISTIKHAEQIIVLDDGNVVGQGTHGELLLNCPVYAEIARSQFSDQEMKHELELAKGKK